MLKVKYLTGGVIVRDEEVFAKFYISCYARRIANIILFIGALMEVSSKHYAPLRQMIGIILIVAGAVIQFIYWRCPVCGKHLPYRGTVWNITYCINCGTRLKP